MVCRTITGKGGVPTLSEARAANPASVRHSTVINFQFRSILGRLCDSTQGEGLGELRGRRAAAG